MEPDNRPIDATYTVEPQPVRRKGASGAMVLAVIASCVAGVALIVATVTITLYMGQRNVTRSQAAQIHALDQSNTNLAGKLAALSNKQAQISAQVAADSSNSDLVTCSDLKEMGLTSVSGGSGSVTSVPGTVYIDLSTSRIKLPRHCQ